MPILIIVKIFLVISAFFADQLSSFHDAKWSIAELSFSDPFYLGFSLLWLAVIVWIIHDIIKKKPGVPQTVIAISLVCAIFIGIELFESTLVLISFESLELLIWIALILICKTQTSKNWYSSSNKEPSKI